MRYEIQSPEHKYTRDFLSALGVVSAPAAVISTAISADAGDGTGVFLGGAGMTSRTMGVAGAAYSIVCNHTDCN